VRWTLFLYPWLELWSLIQLGIETSPALALMWVLGALVMGSALMRWAGRSSLQRLAQASAGGTLPEQLLMADFALILSGLLLAIPGLVSDLLAVLILIKPLRRASRNRIGVPCCCLDVSYWRARGAGRHHRRGIFGDRGHRSP
jgi:UPF0716 protein FxsA